MEFLQAHLADLHFTERSSLARIGIEMHLQGPPTVDGHRLLLSADAFIYDANFPNAAYWKKLLRPGSPVGRLFYAPAAAKLSSAEIWAAIKANDLKLPNTISIDSRGRVFLTPHQVNYTLSPRLQRLNFELIVSGNAGRNFLDKVQIRHDASPLTIPPRSGILTSCSMYLKEHYVVLNQGEGNFGLHTSAVLLRGYFSRAPIYRSRGQNPHQETPKTAVHRQQPLPMPRSQSAPRHARGSPENQNHRAGPERDDGKS
jgi:hypothetical protein